MLTKTYRITDKNKKRYNLLNEIKNKIKQEDAEFIED